MSRRPSLWDRARSLHHALRFALSERSGRLSAPAKEIPVGALDPPGAQARERIAVLADRYAVRFEYSQDQDGALQAYEYLDLLDQALTAWCATAPHGGVVHDVGCASFGYASALTALCRPRRLVGIELEGYRRLRGGVNRAEKAAANVARLPGAAFTIGDYSAFEEPADLITAFFPFLTPAPVLGWRLPLSVLKPAMLFRRMGGNLNPGGRLWMVNHSEAEEALARGFAENAALRLAHRHVCIAAVKSRALAPVVTEWVAAGAAPD